MEQECECSPTKGAKEEEEETFVIWPWPDIEQEVKRREEMEKGAILENILIKVFLCLYYFGLEKEDE